MALFPTSAAAQSVEVLDEATGLHCSMVTIGAGHQASGGCVFHAVSETNTSTISHSGTSETVTSTCETEFTVHGGPAGGYVAVDDNTIHTDPLAGCAVTACDEAAPDPHPELEWPISGLVEYGGSREALLATFCIRPFNTNEGEGNTACTLILEVVQAAHAQELIANSEPCFENPADEVSGHWVTDGTEDELELQHVHYPVE